MAVPPDNSTTTTCKHAGKAEAQKDGSSYASFPQMWCRHPDIPDSVKVECASSVNGAHENPSSQNNTAHPVNTQPKDVASRELEFAFMGSQF